MYSENVPCSFFSSVTSSESKTSEKKCITAIQIKIAFNYCLLPYKLVKRRQQWNTVTDSAAMARFESARIVIEFCDFLSATSWKQGARLLLMRRSLLPRHQKRRTEKKGDGRTTALIVFRRMNNRAESPELASCTSSRFFFMEGTGE